MKLEVDFSRALLQIERYEDQEVIQNAMTRLGEEAELIAKDIVNTFVNSKGFPQGVDSGAFRDGINSTPITLGFVLRDSVPHGVWHEFGTEEHWVPFFDEMGSLTSLGQWAMRHFDNKGESVLEVRGKKGKALKNPTRDAREEVLREMGGIMVSLDEMAAFRRAIDEVQKLAPKIFEEEWAKWQKQG